MYNNNNYNSIFNFVIKERGFGKTHGTLKKGVKDKTKDIPKNGGTPHVL